MNDTQLNKKVEDFYLSAKNLFSNYNLNEDNILNHSYDGRLYKEIRNTVDSIVENILHIEGLYDKLMEKSVSGDTMVHSLLLTSLIEYMTARYFPMKKLWDEGQEMKSNVEHPFVLDKEINLLYEKFKSLEPEITRLAKIAENQKFGFIGLNWDFVEVLEKYQGMYSNLRNVKRISDSGGAFAHNIGVLSGEVFDNALYNASDVRIERTAAYGDSLQGVGELFASNSRFLGWSGRNIKLAKISNSNVHHNSLSYVHELNASSTVFHDNSASNVDIVNLKDCTTLDNSFRNYGEQRGIPLLHRLSLYFLDKGIHG